MATTPGLDHPQGRHSLQAQPRGLNPQGQDPSMANSLTNQDPLGQPKDQPPGSISPQGQTPPGPRPLKAGLSQG